MKFIEWELEHYPEAYKNPRCDEFIDRMALLHVLGNVDCPDNVSFDDFKSVMMEVYATLNLFPWLHYHDIF